MSETTKYLLITTVVAFAAAAFVLWFVDLLYTDRTGKPASERIREKEKQAKPLTVSNFRSQIVVNTILGVLWSIILWWDRGRSSDRLVLPIAMIVVSGTQIWDTNRRWKRQQTEVVQSSEVVT